MIIVLKNNAAEKPKKELFEYLTGKGINITSVSGESQTVWCLIGDTSLLDKNLLEDIEIVDSVMPVSDSFKLCSRKYHEKDTVIEIGKVKIGGGNFVMIAGPCSVENEEQILSIAKSVKKSGAQILRGGAFKPRTSPYDFQGLKADGIKLLEIAKKETGLPVVSEVLSVKDLPLFENIDILQIGARNMQNYELLCEVGKTGKPVLLKRGMSNTLSELLLSAEYIMNSGNEKVILCERGIRTFENATRNTLDLSAVPALHELSHLPIIVDPSHATGKSSFVTPMALAAVASGADGVMAEVHNLPFNALCDGAQALKPDEYSNLCKNIKKLRKAIF